MPLYWLGLKQLKGTLFQFCLWCAGTLSNDETATKTLILNSGKGRGREGREKKQEQLSNKKLSANSEN